MRRPVVLMAISFALGIATRFYLDIPKSMSMAGIFAAGFGVLFMFFVRPRKLPSPALRRGGLLGAVKASAVSAKHSKAVLAILAALIYFFAGALNLQMHTEKEDYFVSHAGESITFYGNVTSAEKKRRRIFSLDCKNRLRRKNSCKRLRRLWGYQFAEKLRRSCGKDGQNHS